jgi:hypothetical protein
LNLHRFVSSIAAGTDRNTDSLTRRIASKNKLAGWPWAHGTSHVALFGKIARPESNPTLTRNPGWGYFGAVRLRLVQDRRRKRGSAICSTSNDDGVAVSVSTLEKRPLRMMACDTPVLAPVTTTAPAACARPRRSCGTRRDVFDGDVEESNRLPADEKFRRRDEVVGRQFGNGDKRTRSAATIIVWPVATNTCAGRIAPTGLR